MYAPEFQEKRLYIFKTARHNFIVKPKQKDETNVKKL